MFLRAFSWIKMYAFWLKFHWSLFLRVQLTIFQHMFRWWIGADQATSHYLNQWWLDYWSIYASLRLSELTCCHKFQDPLSSTTSVCNSFPQPFLIPIFTQSLILLQKLTLPWYKEGIVLINSHNGYSHHHLEQIYQFGVGNGVRW